MAKFPPPQKLTFSIKTDLQTFNHVNDYVIHNEIIWYRRRHQTEQAWTPMYFDGYPDKKPLKIQADGANLIVIDTANYIHYKKILKETLRIFEIEAQEHGAPDKKHPMLAQNDATDFTIKDGTIWVRFKDKKNSKWQPFYFPGWPNKLPVSLSMEGTTLTIHDNENQTYLEDVSREILLGKLKGQIFPYRYHYAYSAIAKDSKDNWKDRWFSLPYLNEALLSMYKEKRLKLPENVVDFAISNRGGYCACWEDFAGSEHPSCPGIELPGEKDNFSPVSGCYAVLEGEHFIRFADPWLPGGFDLKSFPMVPDKKIDLPTDFQFEKLSASASMLFISGRNSRGERRLYCRIADFDTTGMNPFLPYGDLKHESTEKHPIKPELRILPKHSEDDLLWDSISLAGLEGRNVDFKKTTVLQTGIGNNAKELRIASAEENEQGYYWKSLQENLPWAWHPAAA